MMIWIIIAMAMWIASYPDGCFRYRYQAGEASSSRLLHRCCLPAQPWLQQRLEEHAGSDFAAKVLAKLATTVTRGVERSDAVDNVLDERVGQGLLTEGQKRS